MADFSALKTSIQNYIKQNGNEEITGNLLQQILLSMVSTLGDSAINDLVTALNAEIANRGNADTELGGRITTLQGVVNGIKANVENGYVYAGIATPSTTPVSGKVFYLALTAGTYTNFGATVVPQGINILKYNGSAWSLDSFLGLDDAPTQGSSNFVKSGGVLDSIIKDGSAFDLSAYNNGTTYADLSAALTALNALPADFKKGGMSVKFVQTSDNKYVQYRYMGTDITGNPNPFLDTANWQGVDAEPTAGSDNLVKSGGVRLAIEDGDIAGLTSELLLIGNLQIGLYNDIVWNRFINTDGTLAYNDNRSLLKVPVLDYKSLIVLSGIGTLVRYAFCSENPDLYSSQAAGFISATTTSVQPTSIPSNAKWIIYDFTSTSAANNVYVTYTNNYFKDNLEDSVENPILKNHTFEIRYRGTAQLCWDDDARKLYWTDGVTNDAGGDMINLHFAGKVIRLGVGSYRERILYGLPGNAQLLLPLPSGNSSSLYTLNDIVVVEGTTYDETVYVKIAHITYTNAISSFIVHKEIKDNVIKDIESGVVNVGMEVAFANMDINALTPNYDYVQNLLINASINDDGKLQTYVGRYAVFFKMPEKGVAPTITSDVAPAVYQWYSGKPDYINGSNSIERTTTNTPASNAEYCGLTFVSGQPTTIKVVGNTDIADLRADISRYGSNLNNSVGEDCFANGIRTDLKILAYGNSFMRNSIAYLSSIAKNGCNVSLTVGNLYTGGTELQDHLAALQNDSAIYAWYKYQNGSLVVDQSNQRPTVGLLAERWDAIIVHQYIPWQYPFEPTLNKFLKLIIEKLGYTPKIYINATWAGSLDQNETYYGYDTEEEMWAAMLAYVRQACEDAGVQEYSIIPTGTAIQNARTLSWADSYHRFVNYVESDPDKDLHHLNPAGGFIAACTVYQKIVAKLNGVPCSNTTFRITTPVAMPPQTSVQDGILVTDDNYQELCKCAIDAVNSPYTITQQ